MTPVKETKRKTQKQSTSVQSSIGAYAVQCGECFKWRLIDTQEEYEEIRSKFVEEPFFCNKKAGISCKDPADISYDDTRTWVVDKPNIPKPPKGFRRDLVMRKDFSRLDAYYSTPTRKKVRSPSEVAAYLNVNPDYKALSISDFNFSCPKIMDDTIPAPTKRNVSAEGSNRKMETSQKKDDKDKPFKVYSRRGKEK